MKKLFNTKKLHENQKYENQILTHNINIHAFEEELFSKATICNNADIEYKYVNRIAIYDGILYVVKIRIYVDTRTNIVYTYKLTDNYYSFDYYVDLMDQIPEDKIIPLQTLKPIFCENFFLEEDYEILIEALI